MFTAVELGAGDGTFARLVLERFPRCRMLALDGSDVMLERAGRLLAPFGARAEMRQFALEREDWPAALPVPLRCVLSSLAVHHLSGEDKRKMFVDLAGRLEPGGALLLADLVEAATPRVAGLFAAQWDDAARARSVARLSDARALESFRADRWNFYRLDAPDPVDQPSRLVDQLNWLREAGFGVVDCFWMHAGHAIYGGYRSERRESLGSVLHGLLLKESLADDGPLDLVHVIGTKLSRVGSSVPPQPTWWTEIRFEAGAEVAEEIAQRFSTVLGPAGWYLHFWTDTHVFVVFPGRVFKYVRGDTVVRDEAIARRPRLEDTRGSGRRAYPHSGPRSRDRCCRSFPCRR